MFHQLVFRTKRNRFCPSLNRFACGMILSLMSLQVSAQPDEASPSKVQMCKFIGRVDGSSGYGKNQNWQGIAKFSALKRAEKLGASHVVWERFTPIGAFNGSASGRAYSCDS